jgi:hypothetical protein
MSPPSAQLIDLQLLADFQYQGDVGRSQLRDLDRLQEATIEKDGKRITTRTHVTGQVGSVFQAAGIALSRGWNEHAV